MVLKWEQEFGDRALGCEEIGRLKVRSGGAGVKWLVQRVSKARCRSNKAQQSGSCRGTKMRRARRCGFMQRMDVSGAENAAGSERP